MSGGRRARGWGVEGGSASGGSASGSGRGLWLPGIPRQGGVTGEKPKAQRKKVIMIVTRHTPARPPAHGTHQGHHLLSSAHVYLARHTGAGGGSWRRFRPVDRAPTCKLVTSLSEQEETGAERRETASASTAPSSVPQKIRLPYG